MKVIELNKYDAKVMKGKTHDKLSEQTLDHLVNYVSEYYECTIFTEDNFAIEGGRNHEVICFPIEGRA